MVSKPKSLGGRPKNQRSDSLFLSALKSRQKRWCGCGEKSKCSPKVSKPKGLGRRPINQRSDSLFLSALKSHWKACCGCGEKSRWAGPSVRMLPSISWYEEHLLHHTSLGSLMVLHLLGFIDVPFIGLGSPLSDDVMDLYEKSCNTFALQYGDFVAHKKVLCDRRSQWKVTTVGINTEWGLLMASISEDSGEQTPLQILQTEDLRYNYRFFTGHIKNLDGSVQFVKGHTSVKDAIDRAVKIFTVAVTIMIVVVPEGLPLAVTLILNLSAKGNDESITMELWDLDRSALYPLDRIFMHLQKFDIRIVPLVGKGPVKYILFEKKKNKLEAELANVTGIFKTTHKIG
ncbi:hypothetical protein IEQ34_009922 [Dendrobium chrysotoxum]|uniref:Uncharacterized protein n=1 Tax=Dendrobium chrysotoxum TaxID=161865 RepID=A0AAV7H3B9_DENCH|nr:hypothetical protein IEQ34_009922 [Dendrobium chrysotoxum]